MVEVREIDAHADSCSSDTDSHRFQEVHHLVLSDGLHQPGQGDEQDDEQIVIGHLHMVGIDLKRREYRHQQESPQIFSPVGEHHTRYHRRQVGQRPHLPDMSGGNDDQEIGGEGPEDTSQCCQMLTEVKRSQQDIEPQQIGEHVPHVLRQPEMIGVSHLHQQVGRSVRRCHLVRRHATEQGICPTRTLPRLR